MDEFAFAYINTHMAEGPLHRVEEHQVARLEFAGINGFGDFGLFRGAMWQQFSKGLLIKVANKAAAVKACVLADPTPAVWDSQQSHGLTQQVTGFFANGLLGL